MKKSERRMILLLIIVAIIVIAVLVKVRNGKNQSDDVTVENQIGNAEAQQEFVEELEDGTKINTSSKFAETKTFGNYEVSNIQLTQSSGQSLILADVKNIGTTKAEMTLVEIILLDKEGNKITSISGIIGEVEPGETVQLNSSATIDFANAYDFKIEIKGNE